MSDQIKSAAPMLSAGLTGNEPALSQSEKCPVCWHTGTFYCVGSPPDREKICNFCRFYHRVDSPGDPQGYIDFFPNEDIESWRAGQVSPEAHDIVYGV
jgi:hypothetical protein